MSLAPEPGSGMTSQRTRDRMVARLRECGISDEVVLEAMRAVPRHVFVDEALASRAYDDSALPIGFEQTISQPLTVARMISPSTPESGNSLVRFAAYPAATKMKTGRTISRTASMRRSL